MLNGYALAVAVFVGALGPVRADTFLARLVKVEDGKVTFARATYHEGKAGAEKYTFEKPETAEVAKGVTVTRGHFLPAAGPTATTGRITGKTTPIKDGLASETFKDLAAKKQLRPGLITVANEGDDKGKITAINLWSSAFPK